MDNERPGVRRVWLRGAFVLCTIWSIAAAALNADPPSQSAAGPEPGEQKTLRVVKFHDQVPGRGDHPDLEATMIRDFARAAHVDIEWVNVFRSAEALERLVDGDADISISPIPIDHNADMRLLSSEPVGLRRYRVIGQQQATIESPLDLAGMSLAVKLSSPMWPYLDQLRSVLGDLRLQVLPDDVDREEILQLVSDGVYDAALLASEAPDRSIVDFPRTKYLFDLTGPQPMSWFTRADRSDLLAEVNAFIRRSHTEYQDPDARLRSFEDVKKQGRLRVITRIDGNNYFLQHGRPKGFELGLARRFAKQYGLRLEVLVARDDDQIVQWLKRGVGDIVTARINENKIYGEPGFTMSREYRHEASVLVSRVNTPLATKEALAGGTLAGYEGSPNITALETFVPEASIIRVSRRVRLGQLLERIENGVIDGAVVDAKQLDAVLKDHPALHAGMSIPNPFRYRWTLRGDDRSLAQAVDTFLQSEYRKSAYNVLERRYADAGQNATDIIGGLSPFDDLLRDYSNRYGFDWRLIAAVMYQESRFNPNAVSHAGAVGLMQLMPKTAQALGVKNLGDPEAAIHAGVKYLNRLRDRFDRYIPAGERTWLALAAYNVGFDRVRRARERARRLGLNPNKWFGNVEVAMRDMAHVKNREPCSCDQTIAYVRAVRSLYYAYRNARGLDKAPALVRASTQEVQSSTDERSVAG